MIHTEIGTLGHLFVIASFVTSLVATFAYYKVTASPAHEQDSWRRFARASFLAHSLSVAGVVGSLFFIIYNHYYEYHYAWSHSSDNLPVHYMISCFWEGQEGSFLLWIFWHVCLGLGIIRTAGKWEAPVMTVFALVQAFLASMILGVVFGDAKIGSSPFLLLREAMPDLPIFKLNPDFIPKDGNGLNPLLQNYWMVIHPPTLFLGFAITLVPFAYCIAGLYTRDYRGWVRPALPWALFGVLVLGVGIMMGAYWAYETLNFGGYWNWDPVENAVYVPWLILVGSVHVMITFQKSNTALKASIVLVIATFISILYATFLTRSGVLGNASVHAFTDLGLSGQLLVYLFAFMVVAIFFAARAWRHIPTSQEEVSTYSREFWIFIGATVLCMAGFQVLIPTSIPVWNAIVGLFGIKSNMAPPTDQVHFYTKFQLWFGVAIALLSGTGQFFWWKKMDKKNLFEALTTPLIVTMIISAGVVAGFGITNWKYIIVATTGVYAIVANTFMLVKTAKANIKLSGGAITHIGIAMMLLGILASSGYSKVVSLNMSGLLYNRSFSEEMNKEHLLLFRNQPQQMEKYTLTYKGPRMQSKDVPGYIDKESLVATSDPYRMVTDEDIVKDGKTYFTKGDTLQVYNENTYYEIEYKKNNGKTFTLYPRIQSNPQMGMVPSPDISSFLEGDLYTHVTNIPDPEKERKWSETEEYTLAKGDTFVINDFIAVLDGIRPGQKLEDEDANVVADIRLLGRDKEYNIRPVYMIKGNSERKIADINEDLGIKISLEKLIIPPPEEQTTKEAKFVLAVNTTQKDWIIMKAMEKPLINILWMGTILMAIGTGIAMVRRYSESKTSAEREVKHLQPPVVKLKKQAVK